MLLSGALYFRTHLDAATATGRPCHTLTACECAVAIHTHKKKCGQKMRTTDTPTAGDLQPLLLAINFHAQVTEFVRKGSTFVNLGTAEIRT